MEQEEVAAILLALGADTPTQHVQAGQQQEQEEEWTPSASRGGGAAPRDGTAVGWRGRGHGLRSHSSQCQLPSTSGMKRCRGPEDVGRAGGALCDLADVLLQLQRHLAENVATGGSGRGSGSGASAADTSSMVASKRQEQLRAGPADATSHRAAGPQRGGAAARVPVSAPEVARGLSEPALCVVGTAAAMVEAQQVASRAAAAAAKVAMRVNARSSQSHEVRRRGCRSLVARRSARGIAAILVLWVHRHTCAGPPLTGLGLGLLLVCCHQLFGCH